jgi:large subunit ribosomal protein L13e
LIVFPRKAGKPKSGDASDVSGVSQLKGAVLPIEQVVAGEEARSIKPEEKELKAFQKLRYARSEARTLGSREKRARDKAEEEAQKVKHSMMVVFKCCYCCSNMVFFSFQFTEEIKVAPLRKIV